MAFTKLIPQSQLPKMNEAQNFPCEGKMICLANVWGKISATDNECLHQGGSLGQGTIKDGKVICPGHGWQWNPKTGVAVDHPEQKLKTYPIKVENGEVFVDI